MNDKGTIPIPTPATEDQLKTLPPGLYILPVREYKTMFNATTGKDVEGFCNLYARILPKERNLPPGFDFEIRPDGCSIVKQFIFE